MIAVGFESVNESVVCCLHCFALMCSRQSSINLSSKAEQVKRQLGKKVESYCQHWSGLPVVVIEVESRVLVEIGDQD